MQLTKTGGLFCKTSLNLTQKPLSSHFSESANLDAIDKDRRTPLYIVAESDKGADIEAAEKDGRKNLHDAVQIRSGHTVVQLISPIPQGFAEYNGSIAWKGSETCKKCGGAICDVLTISGLNWPQGHYYIARSVSEFLIEFYPAFGLHILNWITRIRKRCQEMETITSLHDSTSMRSVMSQEVVVMDAAYIKP